MGEMDALRKQASKLREQVAKQQQVIPVVPRLTELARSVARAGHCCCSFGESFVVVAGPVLLAWVVVVLATWIGLLGMIRIY